MTLNINMLLEWENGEIERILWLNRHEIALIEVTNPRSMPTLQTRKTVEDALRQDKAHIVDVDIYLPATLPEELL